MVVRVVRLVRCVPRPFEPDRTPQTSACPRHPPPTCPRRTLRPGPLRPSTRGTTLLQTAGKAAAVCRLSTVCKEQAHSGGAASARARAWTSASPQRIWGRHWRRLGHGGEGSGAAGAGCGWVSALEQPPPLRVAHAAHHFAGHDLFTSLRLALFPGYVCPHSAMERVR